MNAEKLVDYIWATTQDIQELTAILHKAHHTPEIDRHVEELVSAVKKLEAVLAALKEFKSV